MGSCVITLKYYLGFSVSCFFSEGVSDVVPPPLCLHHMEHQRLGALGAFCRLNFLNVSHIVPCPEHPVCSHSLERLSGEKDVETQVNGTKKVQ